MHKCLVHKCERQDHLQYQCTETHVGDIYILLMQYSHNVCYYSSKETFFLICF